MLKALKIPIKNKMMKKKKKLNQLIKIEWDVLKEKCLLSIQKTKDLQQVGVALNDPKIGVLPTFSKRRCYQR